MANPEHVALARDGALAIAQWRQAHTNERLDVSGADLSGADLSGADLGGADLSGADLSGADLSGANLSGANLSGANLSGANLTRCNLTSAILREADLFTATLAWSNITGGDFQEAKLVGAELTSADLSGANFTRADLRGAGFWGATMTGVDLRQAIFGNTVFTEADLTRANFRGDSLTAVKLNWANLTDAVLANVLLVSVDFNNAQLVGADLTDASIGYALFSNVDLSRVKGLGTTRHTAPNSIGIETALASLRGAGGTLTPDLTTFFRGAGVLPELLDALPGIVAEVKYYSCFISYGQPDLEFATKLYDDLQAKSVSCWLWEMDKTVGQRTWGEIEQKLDEHDRMVVLCSKAALGREAVKKEIDKQIDKNPDKLVPVSLENCWTQPNFKPACAGRDLKTWLLDRNYADFANKPYEEALEELLKGLTRPEVKKTRRSKKSS